MYQNLATSLCYCRLPVVALLLTPCSVAGSGFRYFVSLTVASRIAVRSITDNHQ
jgi:hypothetical protein